ncbi:MAG: hypothetical protein H7Y18_05360 [Clostridiaceae bacterium]|nr:hypothetical protein [Clostridiaceae bacterium]
MANEQLFHSKKELVSFISEYLINHNNTIVIINRDIRKDLVKTLLFTEDFDKYQDISDLKENVLFLIKTGHKQDRTLSLKVCDAYNQDTKIFKMVDIQNIIIIDGLITEKELKTITYYKEISIMKLIESI